MKELKEQGERTELGFRDISVPLRDRILDEMIKYDVIRGVWIKKEKEEIHKGLKEKVYYFKSGEYNIHGRIFPLDEIISYKNYCDIIVQNWKNERDLNLDAQIYHDFYPGEELKVGISRRAFGKDPSFKLFNHIAGFVKDSRNGLYNKIDEGSEVLVEVDKTITRHGMIHVLTYPLKIIDN